MTSRLISHVRKTLQMLSIFRIFLISKQEQDFLIRLLLLLYKRRYLLFLLLLLFCSLHRNLMLNYSTSSLWPGKHYKTGPPERRTMTTTNQHKRQNPKGEKYCCLCCNCISPENGLRDINGTDQVLTDFDKSIGAPVNRLIKPV